MNMKVNSQLKKISLAIISGVVCYLAFPPYEITSLAWFAFLPLFMAIKDGGYRASWWLSYLSGLVFFGCLLSWLVNVTIPGTILLVAFLSLFYGFFGLAASFIIKRKMDLMVIPFIWVVVEFVRGNLFTGFPWGLLAYSQYDNTNIIQIADLTGSYGVSFLIMAFNVGLFAVAIRSKRKISYLMLPLLFMLLATTYGVYKMQNINYTKTAEISVVQGNIPQRMKWDEEYARGIITKYTDLTEQAASIGPDLVIWPETSYPYLVPDGVEVEEIKVLTEALHVPILAGLVYSKGDMLYNSAVLFKRSGEYEDIYFKNHLVPFGEYIPFEDKIGFLRGYIDKPIGNYGRGKDKVLFPLNSFEDRIEPDGSRVRELNFLKFGVLICFEDVFPYISREYVNKGADFLVNMTNDAWFGETAAAKQHLIASVFRAVENRVPVVRAANTGISAFIDPFGRVTSMVGSRDEDIFITGFDSNYIRPISARRFYTYYGDVFVYFCAFMIVLLLATEILLYGRKGSRPD